MIPGTVTAAWADPYFNSSEPGCDGSNPDYLMCDDFEDGIWYRTNCDTSGGVTNPDNDGWCGTIYASISPADAVSCGGAGAAGTNCAATSGAKSGIGGSLMADHSFVGETSVSEVYVRYYYKASSNYVWGWQKALTFNQCCAGTGGIKWGNLHFPCNGTTSCAPAYQFTVPEDLMQGQNQGNPLTFQRNRWYYVEVHVKLNTPVDQPNGVVEMWLDDCGTSGTACTGAPTLRLRRTNARLDRNSTTELIGSIWWENWANPGSSGQEWYDQVIVSKTGPVGFIGGSVITAPPAPGPLVVQ